ncbi:MAG: hypothetical protein K0R14_176 [Burkholderiales bacterium]|jgi:uncharacterized alpha/beta hydrolase family protein|nr:hypothetical protein [Burkholderiales bacterium]
MKYPMQLFFITILCLILIAIVIFIIKFFSTTQAYSSKDALNSAVNCSIPDGINVQTNNGKNEQIKFIASWVISHSQSKIFIN